MPKLCRIDLEDREGIHKELLRFVEVLKQKLPAPRSTSLARSLTGRFTKEATSILSPSATSRSGCSRGLSRFFS